MTLHPDKMWEDLKFLENIEGVLSYGGEPTSLELIQLSEIIHKYKRVLSQWKEEPK